VVGVVYEGASAVLAAELARSKVVVVSYLASADAGAVGDHEWPSDAVYTAQKLAAGALHDEENAVVAARALHDDIDAQILAAEDIEQSDCSSADDNRRNLIAMGREKCSGGPDPLSVQDQVLCHSCCHGYHCGDLRRGLSHCPQRGVGADARPRHANQIGTHPYYPPLTILVRLCHGTLPCYLEARRVGSANHCHYPSWNTVLDHFLVGILVPYYLGGTEVGSHRYTRLVRP
jgi:hypothetical protein